VVDFGLIFGSQHWKKCAVENSFDGVQPAGAEKLAVMQVNPINNVTWDYTVPLQLRNKLFGLRLLSFAPGTHQPSHIRAQTHTKPGYYK
jgi:hypothetical protein